MKKIIACAFVCLILFSACSTKTTEESNATDETMPSESSTQVTKTPIKDLHDAAARGTNPEEGSNGSGWALLTVVTIAIVFVFGCIAVKSGNNLPSGKTIAQPSTSSKLPTPSAIAKKPIASSLQNRKLTSDSVISKNSYTDDK